MVTATLSAVRPLLAVLLVVAAGCGNATETALRPDSSPSPIPTRTIPVTPIPTQTIPATPTPSPTASLSPTATETAVFEMGFGLECYTDRASSIQYEHGFGAALEDVVGFSTFEEAVSDWWENRPDRLRDPEEPLTRSPIEDNKVAFRNEHGHAQLLLLGERFSNGVWTVGSAEECYVPPTFMPR